MIEMSTSQELTAMIVTSYLKNHPLPAADVPAFAGAILLTIDKLAIPPPPDDALDQRRAFVLATFATLKPAVEIKKSVFNDRVICLICGKKFLTLRRHLGTEHRLSPDEYRDGWRLPRTYPISAPAFREARSESAKRAGLGSHPHAARGSKDGRLRRRTG
jgi:predicted transcriptional regulator